MGGFNTDFDTVIVHRPTLHDAFHFPVALL